MLLCQKLGIPCRCSFESICLGIENSFFGSMVSVSWLLVDDSRHMAQGSWFMAHGQERGERAWTGTLLADPGLHQDFGAARFSLGYEP